MGQKKIVLWHINNILFFCICINMDRLISHNRTPGKRITKFFKINLPSFFYLLLFYNVVVVVVDICFFLFFFFHFDVKLMTG